MKKLLTLLALAIVTVSTAHADLPPLLDSPTAANLTPTIWGIFGLMSDESPTTSTVVLDGIIYDWGTPASNGYYEFYFYLPEGYAGYVDVYAFDAAYQMSNVETVVVGL